MIPSSRLRPRWQITELSGGGKMGSRKRKHGGLIGEVYQILPFTTPIKSHRQIPVPNTSFEVLLTLPIGEHSALGVQQLPPEPLIFHFHLMLDTVLMVPVLVDYSWLFLQLPSPHLTAAHPCFRCLRLAVEGEVGPHRCTDSFFVVLVGELVLEADVLVGSGVRTIPHSVHYFIYHIRHPTLYNKIHAQSSTLYSLPRLPHRPRYRAGAGQETDEGVRGGSISRFVCLPPHHHSK